MAHTAKKLAQMGDKYALAREKRLAADRVADKLKEDETALKQELIEALQDAKVDGVTGKIKRVELARKDIIIVDDWSAFYDYVHKHKAYDLLQKRVSNEAVKLRWEDKKKVPGVSAEQTITISLTKV